MTNRLKVGMSVRVKDGIKDPDYNETQIGGWRGKLIEVCENGLVLIAWDSITLNDMPFQHIKKSEDEGYDWTSGSFLVTYFISRILRFILICEHQQKFIFER